MPERSITIPSSQRAFPDTLWPPPRTATSSSFSRAKFSSDYIGYTRASRDDAGVLINAGIPDFPRRLITRITRMDHLSPKCGLKPFDAVMTHYHPFGVLKFTQCFVFFHNCCRYVIWR